MAALRLLADSYFDGCALHPAKDGPHLISVEDGRIAAIDRRATEAPFDQRVAFVMPGLVEAHAHLFLDGGELDFDKRNAYLDAPKDEMLRVARENIARNAAAGVTLVRDAGDRYGVNDAIRAEQRGGRVAVRSPGLGVKRPKRYGGFMARDIEAGGDVAPVVADMAATADDIKIILTGIIDFAAGEVKGAPQFNEEELRAIVTTAHAYGKRTFAHCSGLEGLKVAVAAGVDSIEHGFFMTPDILDVMADKRIAWVPTVSPVHFQWARPELAGWDANTIGNLRRILDGHAEHIGLAHRKGVELVAGSDAGSPGVVHGAALVDEIFHFVDAGVPMAAALEAATTRPRRLWNVASTAIAAGERGDLICFDASPFDAPDVLRKGARLV
ncbi:MAG: amidohydrolase family protein [Methylobacteriaceae bacterium]|nr:amidohydrolase family protein [Rhodoblastus sp.]MCC0005604.1 amidohydrolase family protein [Methylobacteriaceae bacterium]